MYLVFEGLDKTGKGTLEKLVGKFTNYEHIVVDRGPLGYIAYDTIHNRLTDERLEMFESEWDMIKEDAVIVYCFARNETIRMRQAEHEEEVFTYDRIAREAEIYLSVISRYTGLKRCIFVDTTCMTSDECAKHIKWCIDKENW